MSYRFTIVVHGEGDRDAALFVAPDGSLGLYSSVDAAVAAMDAHLLSWGEDPLDAVYDVVRRGVVS